MRTSGKAVLQMILRVVLGSVFIFSGWNKLSHPIEEFQFAIEQYHAFPQAVIPVIARVVPWLELILGTFVTLGFLRRWSARALLFLLAGFILLLASAVVRKLQIDCGCFGEGIHLTPVQALTIDSFLLIGMAVLAAIRKIPFEIQAWIDRNAGDKL